MDEFRRISSNSLNRKEARLILNNLASGTVPLDYANFYNVGRQAQLEEVQNEILSRNPDARIRFVNGDYGAGKTHFLAMIRSFVMSKQFATSHVVLTPRGTPLSNLNAVYTRMVKNLANRPNESVSPIKSILDFVFEEYQKWQRKMMNSRVNCKKFPSMRMIYCEHCHKFGNIEAKYIRGFRSLNPCLQMAITVYRRALCGFHPDYKTAENVIRWIEGEFSFRSKLNYLGAWTPISHQDILNGFKEISKLVSLVGKKGLVVMLDEAEGIGNLTTHQQPQAFQNLAMLIKGAQQCENVYFLYATTPTFFYDVKSHSEYLTDIVYSAPCVDLRSIDYDDLFNLTKKILTIFVTAYPK